MKRALNTILSILCFCSPVAWAQNSPIPHLEKHGTATQLVVDGRPFLILGGELYNSSSSSLDYMRPLWGRLASLPLNTVLTPLSWELIEPREGVFDFTLVDGLIQEARQYHLRLVFLWLASWKNGMSSYAPVWVKQDTRRFPRVIDKDGNPLEVLSPLGRESMEADARAFAALMRHIREFDAEAHTVLMMQVENEVGVLGDSRDRSPAADQAFNAPVPKELLNYLARNRGQLLPEFRSVWEAAGAKLAGTWQEVFGPGAKSDEIFMAWHYGSYIQQVTAAGKAEYPIPMYVNTWLGGWSDPHPSPYPHGGPLPEVQDIWKAAGTAIDIYSPDIYASNFAEWCDRYTRAGNPLFVPEAHGGDTGAAQVFYTVGQHRAIGFSAFGIDSFAGTERPLLTDPNNELGRSYQILMSLAPYILQQEGQKEMAGILLDKDHPQTTVELNGYQLTISLDGIFEVEAQKGFGLIVASGPNEFLGAGSGFRVSFRAKDGRAGHAGIGSIDEGVFAEGGWTPGRRLNGDENDQGRYWRFASDRTRIEKVVLYKYE